MNKQEQVLREMAQSLAAVDKTVKAAAAGAMRKLCTHIKTVSRREVAAQMALTQKSIQGRYVSRRPDENGLRVFVSTWPVDAMVLGQVARLFDAGGAALAGAGGGPQRPGMVLELRLPGGESVKAQVSEEDEERLKRWNRRVSNLRFRR